MDMVGKGTDTIDFDPDSDSEEEESKSGGWFAKTRIGGLFASISGGHVLTKEDMREPLAVLVGDALIVEAFNTLQRGCEKDLNKLGPLVSCIAGAVGMPGGIVAGQAWESESKIDVHQYHRAKTGSLFVGAVAALLVFNWCRIKTAMIALFGLLAISLLSLPFSGSIDAIGWRLGVVGVLQGKMGNR